MREWTPEQRERARARILANQPWKKSSGPKTSEGKAKSKMNAQKHGGRSQEKRSLQQALRETRAFLIAIGAFRKNR